MYFRTASVLHILNRFVEEGIIITENYNKLIPYEEYINKNKKIEFFAILIFYILSVLICSVFLLYAYSVSYRYVLIRFPFLMDFFYGIYEFVFNTLSYLDTIILSLRCIVDKTLPVIVTLNIFTFTACSFLLRDDTTLGLSIYEITNWKFPTYRIVRINSLISTILVVIFALINFECCVFLYLIQVIWGTICQIYICSSIFDYKGNSYVIARELLQTISDKEYFIKNEQEMIPYERKLYILQKTVDDIVNLLFRAICFFTEKVIESVSFFFPKKIIDFVSAHIGINIGKTEAAFGKEKRENDSLESGKRFKEYFSELCMYTNKSKSKYGLNIVVETLLRKKMEEMLSTNYTDEKYMITYKYIDYIISMYINYLYRFTSEIDKIQKEYDNFRCVTNLHNMVKDFAAKFREKVDNKSEDGLEIRIGDKKYAECLRLFLVPITISAVKLTDWQDVRKHVVFLKNEIRKSIADKVADKDYKPKRELYYSLLAILKIYTELEFETLCEIPKKLSYMEFLMYEGYIDCLIFSDENKQEYIRFFKCWAEVNEQDIYEYYKRFYNMYNDLNTNKFKSATGILLKLTGGCFL